MSKAGGTGADGKGGTTVLFGRVVGGMVLLSLLVACGGTGGVVSQSAVESGSGSAATTLSLTGQPRSAVVVGQAYSFQPASSGSPTSLTFSARNLPGWLTLNATTGRLTGTPSSSDVAVYSGLTILASDGVNTATLGPFSISVVAAGSGTASVSWTPPTTNTDGSALTDLAGYVLVYGESQDAMDRSITIDNASISTYVVESLPSGTWYFAVQAMNANGVRSSNSTIVSKTIS